MRIHRWEYGLALIGICFLFTSNATAATVNAASCSLANVQSAVNSAAAGSTVAVPACTASWSGALTVNKNIILQGAGSTSTYITGGSITIQDAAPRITGFNFNATTVTIGEGIAGRVNGFRIDHNAFVWATNSATIMVKGNTTSTCTTHPTGVFDNNDFTRGQILFYGDMALGASNGDNMYYLNDAMGTGSNVVYIEDNNFHSPSFESYAIDANYGGRYVVRYNTLTNRAWEHHGIQGNENRGVPRWEIYNNTFSTTSSYWAPLYIRSGGGVVFNNTATGFTGWISIDNQTSCRYGNYNASVDPNWAACDGNNPRDGNRSGKDGYPCRDQIGRGRDTVKGHVGDTQVLSPMYSWNNKLNGSEGTVKLTWDVDCPRNQEHLVADRDYYNGARSAQTSPTSPFTGTAGVGYGTLANRPTTCTTNASESGGGVAYWATDQNTLYRCSATNTWTVHYRPYTYPHPLRGESGIQTPANLRIVQ